MIKIGVIGYGYWGPNLVRNFMELPGARVASVADLDPSKLDQVVKRFPSISVTRDYRDLLSDPEIDVCAIATPVSTHFDLGMAALKAGKHLWLEKPMAETADQAARLADEAERRNLTLHVDHTFIYTGAVRKIADLVTGGELGKIFYYDSTRVNMGLFQQDVSVVADLAVHDFSILDHILGEQPTELTASGVNHFPQTPENLAYITLFYDSGVIAHVNVSWLAPVKVRTVLIGGAKKMLVYDDLQPSEKLKVYDKGVTITDDPKQIYQMRVGYRTGDMFAPKLDEREALRVGAEHFLSCIENGAPSMTDGRLGLRVVQVVAAATESMAAAARPSPSAEVCLHGPVR